MKTYEHLCASERRRIERLTKAGLSLRTIAERLGRSASTLSDEVRKRSIRDTYDAQKAAHKAYVKRKYSKVQNMKVVTYPGLRTFVEEKLTLEWTPEMIAGRIKKVERHLPRVSAKAIYKFVRSIYGRKLEQFLYSKMVKRKSGPKRGRKQVLDGRTSIERRPKRIEKRRQFGHFEGDFIESGKDGTGSLLTLVERKTRYPFLVYCPDRTTGAVNALVFDMLRDVPLLSLTLDNDVSFKKHRELSALIGAAVFFCHPYASHEKGTVENRNRVVRRTVPKRTDLSQVSLETFLFIQEKMRDTPMKCLGWLTPREAWEKETKKAARNGSGMLRPRVLKANARCSA